MVYRAAIIVSVLSCIFAVGCVPPSPEAPNSDAGHLYVEDDQALAVDWEANLIIRGPTTGGSVCDDQQCMSAHRAVSIESAVSSDPEVIEVVDWELKAYGEVEFMVLTVKAHGAGEAKLDLEVEIEGYDPEDTERSDDDYLVDSFSLEARDVEEVALSRLVGEQTPGPYQSCPARERGVHLLDSLGSELTLLRMEKRDADGELLRGGGHFPVDIEPAEVATLADYDEAQHLVTLEAEQWGEITATPEQGEALTAIYAPFSEVQSTDTRLYALNQNAGRIGEVEELVVNYMFEVASPPALAEGESLCQGAGSVAVTSQTPAVCDVVATIDATGNPGVVATYGGECVLEVTLASPDESQTLVETWAFPAVYQ